MNASQSASIQALTTRLARRSIGQMSFAIEPTAGNTVLLAATNVFSDLRWFERTNDFYAIVGPRGGIRKYAGNLSA